MRLYFQYDIRAISKDNEKIRGKHEKYFLSAKYKQFESDIWHLTKQQLPRGFQIFKHDVTVNLAFYFRTKTHCDMFNLPKSIMDACSGCLFLDDRLIKHGKLDLVENHSEDCIIMEVTDDIEENKRG